MPTSSQSKILSVVDYQLLYQQQQQQQTSGPDGITNPSNNTSINQTPVIETKRPQSRDDRHLTAGKKYDYDEHSPPPPNLTLRRRNSRKTNDGTATSQRNDILHLPIVNLNTMTNNTSRTSIQSSQYHRNSFHDDDQIETEYNLKQMRTNPTPMNNGNNSSLSDLENPNDNEEENQNYDQRSSLLNENARRLLILGTIRPSKSFYKNLPESDVEHLMEYFRRMRNINRKITSEEINQELKTKFTEYKPKMFYDSTGVTKAQVNNIEKIIEQYADEIRAHRAELIKLDNPFRFVIKPTDSDTPLTTIPREYNDCLLTLVTRTDPLRKSDLITELIQNKLLEDVKANSLDISYFPGGVNYDVPHEEIDDSGQMNLETYQKLKKRLNNRKVWYFNAPPEKKPNALLAIFPSDSSITINHQQLLDCLYDHLKTLSINGNADIQQRILSIEFVPLSCILNSYDTSNQFIIDCDTNETKQQLIDKPLKFNLNKQSITIELQSYDENMHKEYEKSLKAQKYQELIKNHDEAVKRTSSTK